MHDYGFISYLNWLPFRLWRWSFLAAAALYWRRLPLLRRGFEPGTGLVRPLRRFQSGVVNDYVTWIVIGVACLGGALAFSIHG